MKKTSFFTLINVLQCDLKARDLHLKGFTKVRLDDNSMTFASKFYSSEFNALFKEGGLIQSFTLELDQYNLDYKGLRHQLEKIDVFIVREEISVVAAQFSLDITHSSDIERLSKLENAYRSPSVRSGDILLTGAGEVFDFKQTMAQLISAKVVNSQFAFQNIFGLLLMKPVFGEYERIAISKSMRVPHTHVADTQIARLRKEHMLSIYKDWVSIAAADSYYTIYDASINDQRYESIQQSYYKIYVLVCYLRGYLMIKNRDIRSKEANAREVEEEFYEFQKYVNLNDVSQTFLPGRIYNLMRKGSEIKEETEVLQEFIRLDAAKQKEAADKRVARVLTLISIFTVCSTFFDLSEWVAKINGTNKNHYDSWSIVLLLLIVGLLIYTFIYRLEFKKRRRFRV